MQAQKTPLWAGCWHSDQVVHAPKDEERKGWGGGELESKGTMRTEWFPGKPRAVSVLTTAVV